MPKKKKKVNVVFEIHWSMEWALCFAAAVKAASSVQTGFFFFRIFNLWDLESDQAYQQLK